NATVMPGDLVFGDREGVYFVPPHLVEEVLRKAETTHIHDEWTKNKFLTGKYKSTEIYPSPQDPLLKKEDEDYIKKKLEKGEGESGLSVRSNNLSSQRNLATDFMPKHV